MSCCKNAYRDSEVVTTSQLCDFSNVSKAGTHNNGLIAILFVVVENLLYALDTWVFLSAVVPLVCCLIPIKDTADEGGDEESACFSCSDGLRKGEHEGQIAIDAVLRLQNVRCLDALPCRGKFDKNAGFVDAD